MSMKLHSLLSEILKVHSLFLSLSCRVEYNNIGSIILPPVSTSSKNGKIIAQRVMFSQLYLHRSLHYL